jgi:hypothetical protein
MRTMRFLTLLVLSLLPTALRAADEDKDAIALTGQWNGSYAYAAEDGREPVKFAAVILQRGKEVTGFIREVNTFGVTDDPWLHALLKGTIDPETRQVTFTKTYDGTAGVNHDVEYSAALAKDGDSVEGGAWKILDFAGTFELKRDAKVKVGPLAGLWRGTNEPPKDTEIPSIKVTMVLLHQGDSIVGFAREPRVGADGTNPWFHATIKGSYDEKSGAIKLLKSYDGTAKASAEEEYLGKLSGEDQFEGKRTMDDKNAGTFVLKREALKE